MANDNGTTNIVKIKFDKAQKVTQKKKVVASVFLHQKDIGLNLPQVDTTLVLNPRAAYELALLLLQAIKAGADKYTPKDK